MNISDDSSSEIEIPKISSFAHQTNQENDSSNSSDEITTQQMKQKEMKVKKEMKEMKQPKQKKTKVEAKRQSMSFDGEQETLSIALLMRHGIQFVLTKPRILKKSENRQIESVFITIHEIIIGKQHILFDQIIKERITEGEEVLIGCCGKQRIKYQKRNLISITNNFLCELLNEMGYLIGYKKNRETHSVVKMNRIVSITGHKIEIESRSKVKEIGFETNKIICDIFIKEASKNTKLKYYTFTSEYIQSIFSDSIQNFDKMMNYIIQVGKNTLQLNDEKKETNETDKNEEKNEMIQKKEEKEMKENESMKMMQEEDEEEEYNEKKLQNNFKKDGYEIRYCEFGWYASQLKK